jgi:hypothetical protein
MRITHPSAGPRYGHNAKSVVIAARSCNNHKSAFVPAPTTSGGLPNTPARKRHIVSPAKVLEKPEPRMKMANSGIEIRYVAVRPYFSLNGAASTGPKPRPMRKREKGRRATVWETWNVDIISDTAEV